MKAIFYLKASTNPGAGGRLQFISNHLTGLRGDRQGRPVRLACLVAALGPVWGRQKVRKRWGHCHAIGYHHQCWLHHLRIHQGFHLVS